MLRGTQAILLALAAVGCAASTPVKVLPPFSLDDAGVTAADSLRIRTFLYAATDSFIRFWRYHWEVSDRYRFTASLGDALTPSAEMLQGLWTWPPPPGTDIVVLSPEDSQTVASSFRGTVARSPIARGTLLHCHPELLTNTAYVRVGAYVIESDAGKRAICPSLYPADARPPWDERRGIDQAIVAPLRETVRRERSGLLRMLDRGAALLPADLWIMSQRVRFALDQGDTARAASAVDNCATAEWWCTALQGYLMHARGDVFGADQTFLRMLRLMPQGVRCGEWTDLSLLVEEKGRREYASLNCARREEVNTTLWWLSDPLYSEPGNERRAEHYARRVLLEMRARTGVHERWDMRPEGGGNAVEQMLIRYGWPSYAEWAGRSQDISHYGYLGIRDAAMMAHGRFATAEYSAPRFGMVPTWSAVTTPSRARDFDWAISEAAYRSIEPADTIYWPREHYDRPRGPLVQLWNQYGLFRRKDSLLFAMATRLVAEDFPGAIADTLWGLLITSFGPDTMLTQVAGGAVGSTSIIRSMLRPGPQLLSLELEGKRPAGVVARTRFGIETPPPLSALAPRELAISAPVIIRPTNPLDIPADNPAAAISRMYGTAVFRRPEQLGIYWETYGVSATDSVDLAVRIIRHNIPQPGVVRRIGFALGLGRAPAGETAIGWNEVPPRRAMNIVDGTVPIQGRIITLNVAALDPGDDTLVVTVARPGGTPATAMREFWLLER